MNIYYCVFILLLVFSFVEVLNNGKYRNTPIYSFRLAIVFFVLLYLAGFREVGSDYISYEYYYDTINQDGNWLLNGLELGSEPAFSFLCHVAESYKWLVFTTSLLCISLLFYFLFKYSPLPFVSLLIFFSLFFFPTIMGQQRQAFAILIGLFALMNIENKKHFVLLVAGAAMFHISALLLCLAPFIPKNYKSIWFYVTIFIGALIVRTVGIELYLTIIGNLGGFAGDKLVYYSESGSAALGLNTSVLLRIFILGICFFYKESLPKDSNIAFLINCYFVGLILYVALGFAPELARRGSYYFAVLEMLIVAFLLKGLRPSIRLAFFFGFSLLEAIRLVGYLNNFPESSFNVNILPYKNWLF